jgi:hypothetical protein
MPAEARDDHVDLMNRYAQAIDSRDWRGFAAIFAKDATFKALTRDGTVVSELAGRDQIVATIPAIIESLAATHHLLSNYVVDVAPGGETGVASCYFRAYHGGAGERGHLFEESLGRFDLQTVREDGAWKIRRMQENITFVLGSTEAFGVTG